MGRCDDQYGGVAETLVDMKDGMPWKRRPELVDSYPDELRLEA